MRNEDLDRRIARLAARQHGVFSRRQVHEAGAGRGAISHRIDVGRWERVAHNVFRLSGTRPDWRQTLHVACLSWGTGAVISHRAAAALGRLAGFDEGPVELTVPRAKSGRGPGTVHRSPLQSVDMTTIDGIPVTTPARTLLDLAAVCSNTRVEEALGEALCRGLVSIPRLRWRSAALGRRPGVEMVRELLDARAGAGVPQSVFETRMLRALKRAGLPLPEMQHPVLQAHAVLDFAYPEVLVAIETEGYRWHSGRARWDRDLARRNRLTELGWRVIHVTWQQLSEQPESLIASISATLAETTSNRSAGRL